MRKIIATLQSQAYSCQITLDYAGIMNPDLNQIKFSGIYYEAGHFGHIVSTPVALRAPDQSLKCPFSRSLPQFCCQFNAEATILTKNPLTVHFNQIITHPLSDTDLRTMIEQSTVHTDTSPHGATIIIKNSSAESTLNIVLMLKTSGQLETLQSLEFTNISPPVAGTAWAETLQIIETSCPQLRILLLQNTPTHELDIGQMPTLQLLSLDATPLGQTLTPDHPIYKSPLMFLVGIPPKSEWSRALKKASETGILLVTSNLDLDSKEVFSAAESIQRAKIGRPLRVWACSPTAKLKQAATQLQTRLDQHVYFFFARGDLNLTQIDVSKHPFLGIVDITDTPLASNPEKILPLVKKVKENCGHIDGISPDLQIELAVNSVAQTNRLYATQTLTQNFKSLFKALSAINFNYSTLQIVHMTTQHQWSDDLKVQFEQN